MNTMQSVDPASAKNATPSAIETIIEGRRRDLGGFTVARVLPALARRAVGPVVFFDHMGPATLIPGQGIDVRPHPHIGLATVTYLFDGELVHRDSLGFVQPIEPGAINWMTAGRGIVHSERTGAAARALGSTLHGLQLWVALPQAFEETDPGFRHYPADAMPELDVDGARLRVLVGDVYGAASPVHTLASFFYAEARLPPGTELALPTGPEERAAYIVEGVVQCGDVRVDEPRMIVFAPASAPIVRSESGARLMLLGGASLDGERHLWWNFVSSRLDRIEEAKRDWAGGRFPSVPGETEAAPLPEG